MILQPNNYIVRQSTIEDIDIIMSLLDSGREIMRKSGNCLQWQNGYPSKEIILQDINNQGSYLLYDNTEPIACFTLLHSPEPTYQNIKGSWLDENLLPYYVIHRMGKRVGKKNVWQSVLQFALTKTNHLKVDTHKDNIIMQSLLNKTGFVYCGIIYLANKEERLAYELLNR